MTTNTFKLYQVREQLKQSKVKPKLKVKVICFKSVRNSFQQLYVEEEQILEEFTKVKECLSTNHMDEDEFEAARETCLVLGGKLGAIRRKQDRCYGDTKDLETVIDKEIVACKFEEKELRDMDLTEVRGRTPARQLSPTPLDRHRSQSRERSLSRDYKLPGAKLSQVVSGRQTPDPCAYFSRPSSSLSVYGGRGGRGEDEVDPFRAAMEAKQAEDVSPEPMVMRSATGALLVQPDSECPHDLAFSERPCSAMSDMSLEGGPVSRPGSRMEANGDVVSKLNKVAPEPSKVQLQPMNKAEPKPAPPPQETSKSAAVENKVVPQKETVKEVQEPIAIKPKETETKINKNVTVTAKETKPKKEEIVIKKESDSKIGSVISKDINEVKEESTKTTTLQKPGNSVKKEETKSTISQTIEKEVPIKTEIKDTKKDEVISNENETPKTKTDTSVKFSSLSKDSTNKITKKEEDATNSKVSLDTTAPLKPATKEPIAKKELATKKEPIKKTSATKPEPSKNEKEKHKTNGTNSKTKTTAKAQPQETKKEVKPAKAKPSFMSKLAKNQPKVQTCDTPTKEAEAKPELALPEPTPAKPTREKEASAELFSEAKEIFASIAKESSKNQDSYGNIEPAELVYDADNEDELMMVIDDKISEMEESQPPESVREPVPLQKSASTGYNHLDEFERKLAMMTQDLDSEKPLTPDILREKSPDFSFIKDEITGSHIKKISSASDPVYASLDLPGNNDPVPQVDSSEPIYATIHKPKPASAPVAPPRIRSRSTSRSRTPASFLSAMTGGLVDSQKLGSLGSLVRGRSGSRSRMSRQSSSERPPEGVIPELAAGADVLVSKLITLSNRKTKVEKVDFDELFARGLAKSGETGEEEEQGTKVPMIKFQEETGISLHALDTQQPSTDPSNLPERGRKRQKKTKAPAAAELSVEAGRNRTRSREYAKPQDIKLSPVIKRDLFTGKLLDGTSEEEVFLKRVTKFIAKNQQMTEPELAPPAAQDTLKPGQMAVQYTSKASPLKNVDVKKEEIKSSPGKNFLDSKTGEEMFSKSIEGEFIEYKTAPKLKLAEESLGDPADKNIPKMLKPDSLMRNEEFYENLRSGLKQLTIDKSPQPPGQEEGTRYSQHLGRAEYGTLRRRQPGPASRDSSGDKIKPRDDSGDRYKPLSRWAFCNFTLSVFLNLP